MSDVETTRGTVVRSADRALDILEFVTSAPDAPSFGQIARALDVPKSSLSLLLGNLVSRGYVEIDAAAGTYGPGKGLLSLARRASAKIPLTTLVRPVVEKLRDELNETAGFSIRRGDEVELVAAASSRQALVYIMNVGECAPLYAISPGKIILAQMSDRQFDLWLTRTPLRRFTDTTIDTGDKLRREIETVRDSGFAYANAEFSRGIQGIACAVHVADRFVGSINVSIPQVRFDERLREAAHTALVVAGDELARVLAPSF